MTGQTLILVLIIAAGHIVTLILTSNRINAVRAEMEVVKIHTNSMVTQAVNDAKAIGAAEQRIESDATAASVAIATEIRMRKASVARDIVAAAKSATDVEAAEARTPATGETE